MTEKLLTGTLSLNTTNQLHRIWAVVEPLPIQTSCHVESCVLFSVLFIIVHVLYMLYEPRHDKTNKVSKRPAKTQISMKKPWVLSYPLIWSDWADAHADLSLRWAHTHFVGFCWFGVPNIVAEPTMFGCSAPRGSPGVGRNTFLSSPHLCFIIVFICDLSVSRGDPLMS